MNIFELLFWALLINCVWFGGAIIILVSLMQVVEMVSGHFIFHLIFPVGINLKV